MAIASFSHSFVVLLIWVPVTVVWFGAVADIVSRPDLSGRAKAAWLAVAAVPPFVGTLVYLLAKPRTVRAAAAARGETIRGR